jgi:membrane protein YqaA with SNARE-associated domain
MAKWKLIALFLANFLAKFGIWGIGGLALLDSSTIPVPMDAFIAVAIWNNKSHFLLYCLLASVGSAIGGLLPYGLGRAGGELFLLKRVNRQRYEHLRLRFERQEFLAMMIPSMLPPPTPWKACVFAAGVFEMRIIPFMLAVFSGRMLRWLILSALILIFGPNVVDLVTHHGLALLALVGGLAIAAFAWWFIRKKRSGKLDVD